MLTNDLYQKVLREPLSQGNDELAIVSGYGSAAMVRRHLSESENAGLSVNLVLGMTRKDGLPRADHNAFQELENAGRLSCRYIIEPPDIHAKVYLWLNGGAPTVAFLGSANYSHSGFSAAQLEAMEAVDPEEAYHFYTQAANRAVACTDVDIEKAIRVHDPTPEMYQNNERLTLPLFGTDANGVMRGKSGLNWGFGGGRRRDPNEAYIPLYKGNVRSDFFPGRLEPEARFTIITDDDVEMHASRGQGKQQGKAISTPDDNKILGRYFRSRMGVPENRRFTVDDFVSYGRKDATFIKIDDDTFYMDFAVP